MITYKHMHFIGIGGIGMSALARMCKAHGIEVSGSDTTDSKIIQTLKEEGITISLDQEAKNISDTVDCVVYTVAIPDSNPELREACRRELPCFTYAQMLGEVSRDMYTVAVAGTHGKTTTTAMIADVFLKNERKPHVIVGSLLAQTGSNYIFGKEDVFIVEACEYKRSFLSLNPNILIITNLEEDHLDYYKNLDDIHSAFRELVAKVPAGGYIICDPDDWKVKPALVGAQGYIIDFKTYASRVPEMFVLGAHNRLNASIALAVSDIFKFDMLNSQKALTDFRGTWRRLEHRGELGSIKLYDDYAHHPSEIEAGISAFRERFPQSKLCVVFQPHLYSRSKEFFNEFVSVLSQADTVLMLPIYAAREEPDESISSQMLVTALEELCKSKTVLGENTTCEVFYCPDFASVIEYIKAHTETDMVVVTTGAGDVYKILDRLV